MERKDFLKRAGVGSVALASLPALTEVAWAHDDDDDDGRLRRVRGGGEFIHFDGTRFGDPNNVIATGSWKARRFLSFHEQGTWGVGVSGILQMQIKLIPCDGPVIRGAKLEIVCNLLPAGISNPGTTEGYTLEVPGLAPFRAFMPNIGLTLFTRPCKPGEKDGEEDEEDD
jgi:hypothetical protein